MDLKKKDQIPVRSLEEMLELGQVSYDFDITLVKLKGTDYEKRSRIGKVLIEYSACFK